MSEWLFPKDLAVELHRSEQTLANWRNLGIGPKFARPIGSNRIMYRRSDIDAWLTGSIVGSTRMKVGGGV